VLVGFGGSGVAVGVFVGVLVFVAVAVGAKACSPLGVMTVTTVDTAPRLLTLNW
jgi:hypothetical protein